MTFFYETLDSGLKLLVEEIPSAESVACGVFVKVGSGHEEQKKSGTAHFIEHMMFKGTRRRDAFEIAQAIDRVGGKLNAFTTKEYTSYFVVVRHNHFSLAIDVIGDMFLHSLFEPKEINMEKNVVLEEIKMYQDTPDEQIHDFLLETAWKGHTLGHSTLGSWETVSAFTRGDLKRFLKNHYYPANTLVAVAGRVKFSRVWREVTKFFKNFKGGQKDKFIKTPVFIQRIDYKNKKTEQVHLCLGVKSPSILDEKRYPLTILNTILGAGASSRLFQEIREKRGLVYAVSSYLALFANAGLLGIYAGTSPENFREVVEVILNEFSKLKKECTPKEFADAKEQIKGNFVLGLENPANRMSWFAKSVLYYDRVISVEETFQRIDQVSLDELIDLAEKLFVPLNLVLVAIGPFKKARYRISELELK
jgi:predicted Zn-dependent peptidase